MVEELNQSKGTIWFAIIIILIIFLGAVFAFSKDSPAFTSEGWKAGQIAPREPRRYIVYYEAGVFSPTNLRVNRGDIVEIKNASDAVLELGNLEKNIPAGQSVEVSFATAGQVSYFNKANDLERGTIVIR